MILRPPPRARSPSKRSAISRSFTGLLSLSRRASAATGDQRPRSASGSDAHSSFSSEAGDSSTGGADWPTPPETPPATPHSPEQTTPQKRTMAVLCDFGVAKPLPERLRARRTRRSRLGPVDPADGTAPKCGPQDLGRQLLAERNFAMTGGVGSCVYCAPEMAACEPYGRRVDIYSFGVALYELLAATVVSARYGLDHPRYVHEGGRVRLRDVAAGRTGAASAHAHVPARATGRAREFRQARVLTRRPSRVSSCASLLPSARALRPPARAPAGRSSATSSACARNPTGLPFPAGGPSRSVRSWRTAGRRTGRGGPRPRRSCAASRPFRRRATPRPSSCEVGARPRAPAR